MSAAPLNVTLTPPDDRIGPLKRRASKQLYVGGTSIGGDAPVRVQSMCTTLTHDVDATIRQIERLQEVGCEIARVAVPDPRGAAALPELVRRSILPLVADIHFDYRLALAALDAGVHKLRLNPGNIHNKDGVREVVRKAKERGTPIRIGVNHGSIGDRKPDDVRDEAQRMVDLAMSEIKILEDLDFTDIVVSVKAFDVPTMVAAYRRLSRLVPYPLHLGVTEAGTLVSGSIRSTAGMSVLLYEGIGDTIRVSLSEDPVEEVKAGFDILKSLGLRDQGLTLVADIHFDHRLALAALDAGVHKLRLNPGNIHNKAGVREVVRKAKERGTPIRIGVNHGSIGDRKPDDVRDEAQRMVDLAMSEIKILEDLDFTDIVVSVKAFDVPTMVAAYRRLARLVPYPLHLGVTEAGTLVSGSIRSTAGMSVLLYEGIGDTIRVSLSEDPVEEVKAGFDILKSLGLRDQGLTLVACPSCGRADIDLIPLAKVAEERLRALPHPMKVAVMGCEVNGPGEAKDADVGIAGGVGKGALFRKGKVVGVYPEAELLDALMAEVDKILVENGLEPYSDKAPKLSHEGQLTPGRSLPAGTRT